MDYEIVWLAEARQALEAELEYVCAEFGYQVLAQVYASLTERIAQLRQFPRIGVRYKDLDYRGYEIRMLHVKKISIVYSIVGTTVWILYVWNNQQNPDRLPLLLGKM